MSGAARKTTQAGLALPLAVVSLGLLAVFALVYAAPSLAQIPNIDYSIFQYVGERIREGRLPYLDVFDHKPPLIFYLNFLGLALGGGSRWGIWALQLVAVGAAGLLGFSALRRTFGLYAAWLASAAFLLNLVYVHEGGNLTEEYALPFQFAAIGLLAQMETLGKSGRRAFWIGVLLGMASTLKQPLAGPLAAVIIVMLAGRVGRRKGRALLDFAWLGLGFVLVWVAWFGYFAARGALAEFWDAAFRYNFAVAGIPLAQRLASLVGGLGFLLSASPFFSLGLAAWAGAGAYVLLRDERLLKAAGQPWPGLVIGLVGLLLLYNGLFRRGLQLYALSELSAYRIVQIALGGLLLAGGLLYFQLRWNRAFARQMDLFRRQLADVPLALPAFALLDLPVEIGLSALSGDNYRHYFMATLPAFTVLVGFLGWSLLSLSGVKNKRGMAQVWAVLLLIPLAGGGVIETAGKIAVSRDRQVDAAAAAIRQALPPGAPIFEWGSVPMLYALSGHASPSRYFVVKHLFEPGYSDSAQTGIFLAELQANPPAIIIDTRSSEQPLFYETQAADCTRLSDPAVLAEMAGALPAAAPDESSSQERLLNLGRPAFQPPHIPAGMGAVYQWICQNYTPDTNLGGWVVYRYLPDRQ